MVKKKIALMMILAIFTLTVTIWNVSLATSVPDPTPSLPTTNFDIGEVNPTPVIDYKATEISHPLTYWTLTEPIDPYILHALYNLDTWIPCRENETIFLQQVEEHGGVWKIEYQECYYEIEALWSVSPHPKPNIHVFPKIKPLHLIPHTTEHVSSVIGLGSLWGLGTILYLRKKQNVP